MDRGGLQQFMSATCGAVAAQPRATGARQGLIRNACRAGVSAGGTRVAVGHGRVEGGVQCFAPLLGGEALYRVANLSISPFDLGSGHKLRLRNNIRAGDASFHHRHCRCLLLSPRDPWLRLRYTPRVKLLLDRSRRHSIFGVAFLFALTQK